MCVISPHAGALQRTHAEMSALDKSGWDAPRVECHELAEVVAQVSEAVSRAGFPDRAAALEKWEGDLRSGDVERQEAAKRELRGVVHGMGGLLDIHYGSPEEAHRVDGLIDVMWQEIRPDH
jgi:hypothetical protein